MRIPRIYTPQALPQSLTQPFALALDDAAANHVGRVLRMGEGRPLVVFNGEQAGHFDAVITEVTKKTVRVALQRFNPSQNESPLALHLGQAISKGDRMDFTIQKSVELGVSVITPLWTERCDVKLNGDRLAKKQEHWQQVAISACEQSGRDLVPVVRDAMKLSDWLAEVQADVRWVLDPRGKAGSQAPHNVQTASLLVGPEGGLSDDEIQQAVQQDFEAKLIGPRVLRTETAALTAITLLQHQWGDF